MADRAHVGAGLLLDRQAKSLTVIEAKQESDTTSILSEIELASRTKHEWRWLLRKNGASYRVVDVKTQGVSLVLMLKVEVDSMVQFKGFERFLEQLHERQSKKP